MVRNSGVWNQPEEGTHPDKIIGYYTGRPGVGLRLRSLNTFRDKLSIIDYLFFYRQLLQ
jgi:hypothetical protein